MTDIKDIAYYGALGVGTIAVGSYLYAELAKAHVEPPIPPLPYFNALRYKQEIDDITRKLSTTSDDLLPLANFTNVITKADFDTEIQKDFDFFMYFGHGLDDCLFDEYGYCTIYPDSNLKDKILVLTTCNAGKEYAKTAVRSNGAVAAIGYGTPLACQLSGSEFEEGFAECFLNAQKNLLECNEVTESEFVSAYESTKALYSSWGDHYTALGDVICANTFYADGNNLLSYSMWDTMVKIDISVDPTPCEVYKDNVYIGMSPITDYSVMSGGNIFRYKAIGCYLSWIIRNVPKTGTSYSLSPKTINNTKTREYTNMYIEHPDSIDARSDVMIGEVDMTFYNYGDASQTVDVSNDRGWRIHWIHTEDNESYHDVMPHLMHGNVCILQAEEAFNCPGPNLCVEHVNITIRIGHTEDTFSIPICICPPPPTPYPPTPYSSRTLSPMSNQYNRMSITEKNTRNIMIGTKMYTPAEIMKEIDEGTEIGVMLMEAYPFLQ